MNSTPKIVNLLKSPFKYSIWIVIAILFSVIISKTEIIGLGLIFMLIPIAAVCYLIYKFPILSLYLAFFISFPANGLTRYAPVPFGLLIDALLFGGVLLALGKSTQEERNSLKNVPIYFFFAWFIYTTLQLVNPEVASRAAWFYAIRGTSFNFLFIMVIAFIYVKDKKQLNIFLYTWLTWSILAAIWGIKQKMIGLDGAENAWLAAGNASTHVLHGKLRVFSFYSDAGQFGAAMAHSALVFGIIAIGPGEWKKKLLFGIGALLCLYGMAISGTRGALFVPAGGGLIYLIVNKNFKLLILGALVGASIFGVLKYTYIGQGNYEIQRLRSALDPEDASLNVRKENQKILGRYLASRPLGGGIGSSGYFGLRFSPNTFLAQTPTDSWYVRIWAETGIVGLYLHIMSLLGIIIVGFWRVFTMKDPELRNTMGAFLAGFTGIALASYGNSILGQFPTIMACMISVVMIWKGSIWDK